MVEATKSKALADAEDKKMGPTSYLEPHTASLPFGREEATMLPQKTKDDAQMVQSQSHNGFSAPIPKPYGASKNYPKGGPGDTPGGPAYHGGLISGPGISEPQNRYL